MVQFSIVVLLSSRSLSCCAGAFPYDSNVIVLLLALVLIWADRLPFRALCWNFRLFVFHHESDTITDSESFLDSSSASDNDDGDSQEALISATVATPNRQRDFHQAESYNLKPSYFGTAPSDMPHGALINAASRRFHLLKLVNERRLLPIIEEQHRKSPINARWGERAIFLCRRPASKVNMRDGLACSCIRTAMFSYLATTVHAVPTTHTSLRFLAGRSNSAYVNALSVLTQTLQ
jgi:hypothetical protein